MSKAGASLETTDDSLARVLTGENDFKKKIVYVSMCFYVFLCVSMCFNVFSCVCMCFYVILCVFKCFQVFQCVSMYVARAAAS
jgi:hypothetical protein